MKPLDVIADRQAQVSATANALKVTVDRARAASLLLSIAGASAAAVAAALAETARIRVMLTVIGVVCLALAAAISGRFLGSDAVRRHTRARSASEALKRLAFLYAAGAAPFDDPATRDETARAAHQAIEQEIADLAAYEKPAKSKGSCPRELLDFAGYCERRIAAQIKYYSDHAADFAMRAKRLHTLEWLLALLAAALTAAAGVLGKRAFDLAAITAVLTTIGGALVSYLQARKYDDLITSYRGTARRLQWLLGEIDNATPVAVAATKGEEIIAAETQGWAEMLAR